MHVTDKKMQCLFLILPFLASAVLHANQSYLTDSRGIAALSSNGKCVRTGVWKSSQPMEGCDVIPDRVILLPGPDGKVGSVVVETEAGKEILDQAYAAVDVDNAGKLETKIEDAASVQARYAAVLAAQPRRPQSFILKFESGSATDLTQESQQTVLKIEKVLADWPAPEILVTGHTDSVGNLEANDRLSLKRAKTVEKFLIEQGVDAKLIESAGRGEREPLVPTADNVAEPQNRRVELSIR